MASLAAIVNASHDAIIGFSKELKITSWNPAAERIYGYSVNEAIGRGFDLFVPPDELEQSTQGNLRVLAIGQPVTFEQRAQRKDGRWFTSLVNIFAIRDAIGDIISGAGIGHDITHLKEVERELREARDYTRGLIDSSVDAMVVVDRDMRISNGNEQLAKLTEVPKKILIGSRFASYFTDPARATAAIEKTLADGAVTNYDLVLRTAAGSEILVSFNASVFSRAGAVSGIFGVARDVTEQRTIQRKLAEQRHYSRSLVESSPDALLITNSELTLTDLNGQTARLTGYRREELVGIKLASIFTEPEKAVEVVRQALEAGFVHEAELCLLTRSATQIPVSLNASVFKSGDGSARGVIIGVRDISERKRAEKERSLLASIVDASGDAIYSEAADQTITSWNAAAERLFGFGAAEIIGRNAALLVPIAAAKGSNSVARPLQTTSQTVSKPSASAKTEAASM
jgi:PAS domain S-box-containing protein